MLLEVLLIAAYLIYFSALRGLPFFISLFLFLLLTVVHLQSDSLLTLGASK